jgi:hypothetical protein
MALACYLTSGLKQTCRISNDGVSAFGIIGIGVYECPGLDFAGPGPYHQCSYFQYKLAAFTIHDKSLRL